MDEEMFVNIKTPIKVTENSLKEAKLASDCE